MAPTPTSRGNRLMTVQIYTETEEHEQKRLESLASTALLDSPSEERFDRITRLAQKLFGVSTATVSLVAEDRQYLKSLAGSLETNIPRADAFCTHTIKTPNTLIVEDTREDDRFRANPLVLGQPNIRFYAGQPLQGPGGWNIGTLCLIDQQPRTFTPEQQQILSDLAAIVQREINTSVDMKNAAKIQRALLPGTPPPLKGYEIHAYSRPAGDLSGDFYDWQLHDNAVRVTVADAMGKGTGPALLAAAVQTQMRAAKQMLPSDALAAVSTYLDNDLSLDDVFVTAFSAELDTDAGTIRYSDAGHGIAHHVTASGKTTQLPSSGPPLGIMPGQHWATETLHLDPGDSLIIPSDGILEIAHDNLDQLQTELTAIATSASPTAAIRTLINGPSQPTDDLTLLMIRRSP